MTNERNSLSLEFFFAFGSHSDVDAPGAVERLDFMGFVVPKLPVDCSRAMKRIQYPGPRVNHCRQLYRGAVQIVHAGHVAFKQFLFLLPVIKKN